MALIRHLRQFLNHRTLLVFGVVLIGLLGLTILGGGSETRLRGVGAQQQPGADLFENTSLTLLAASLSPIQSPSPQTWTTTGDLNFARCDHTGTLLANGKVLVAGGFFRANIINQA